MSEHGDNNHCRCWDEGASCCVCQDGRDECPEVTASKLLGIAEEFSADPAEVREALTLMRLVREGWEIGPVSFSDDDEPMRYSLRLPYQEEHIAFVGNSPGECIDAKERAEQRTKALIAAAERGEQES